MTLTFDPSTDFEDVTDGLEAVTLLGSGSSTSVTKALQRAVSTKELEASDGKYRTDDTVWHLPFAEVATRPTLGNVIKDAAGLRWSILAVQEHTLSNRWRCVCRDLTIEAKLDDYATIQLARFPVDATYGVAKPQWHDEITVKAKFQPEQQNQGIADGQHDAVAQWRVTLARDFNFTPGRKYRLLDQKGVAYDFVSMENRERIDRFPTVLVEVNSQPYA